MKISRANEVRAYWLRSANNTQANGITAAVRGTTLAAEQIFAMAGEGLGDLDRCTRLARTVAAVRELSDSATPSTGAVFDGVLRRLRAIAQEYAAAPKFIAAPAVPGLLPQGLASLPPHRPADFDLLKLPKTTVINALATLETNTNPVSNPSYALPADPLFATWMKASSQLGTRSVSMAEMEGFIDADVRWTGKGTGMRDPQTFDIRLKLTEGRMHRHEMHKFIGGFRQEPGAGAIDAGRGGETSLFARMTDYYNPHDLPEKWGDEKTIRDYWQEHKSPVRSHDQPSTRDWKAEAKNLTSANRTQLLEQIYSYEGSGFFGNPREEAALRPHVEALLSSEPGSPARARAAEAIGQNFERRASNPDVVSVSGATAEVQMAQTLYRYMADNKLNFERPSDRIDVVEVYKLYRKMEAAGELTTRATVDGWLKQWGTPHVP